MEIVQMMYPQPMMMMSSSSPDQPFSSDTGSFYHSVASSSSSGSTESSMNGDQVSSNKKRPSHLAAPLPEDFVPAPYTVVCGRGKKCAENVGNRRLQVIAQMYIGRYSLATRKEDKSLIVTEILNVVKDACPDKSVAFVRFAEGRWLTADTLCAREKIGTVLRDSLHSKYKSSTKSKLQRRKKRKETAKKEQMLKNLDKVRNPTIQFRLLPLPSEVSASRSTTSTATTTRPAVP